MARGVERCEKEEVQREGGEGGEGGREGGRGGRGGEGGVGHTHIKLLLKEQLSVLIKLLHMFSEHVDRHSSAGHQLIVLVLPTHKVQGVQLQALRLPTEVRGRRLWDVH